MTRRPNSFAMSSLCPEKDDLADATGIPPRLLPSLAKIELDEEGCSAFEAIHIFGLCDSPARRQRPIYQSL
jgi:hypothetical protein